MALITLEGAVSGFGSAVKGKLAKIAISGAPEDQLRGPLENLLHDLAQLGGLPANNVKFIGEAALSDLKTRPDYAVTMADALVGFIEVKAPGKGADPRKFKDEHDKAQWNKLKSLPNLLYTDGNDFSHWRDGELVGKIVRLDGDVEISGTKLIAPPTLVPLISDFLTWDPIPPKTAKKLAEICARLCRLLRDEVVEQMGQGNRGLTALAKDWRKLLFPQADDVQFADGYAQAVTFGLLVARARDISLAKGIDSAAKELQKSNSLVGTALKLLTDDAENQRALDTSLGTLTRVLDKVNWHIISKDKPDAWLYFYEDFLEVYDNKLRKRTGSYYTPPEVVSAMVNLVDEALRGPLFERAAGLAAPDVTVADPAVGTGTFLLGVLRQIATTVAEDQGEGAVKGAIEAAAKRLIGFEVQFGPFAVAQLRIIAEMQALMSTPNGKLPAVPDLNLFVVDTLGNPFVEEETMGHVYEPIAKSRRDANTIKKTKPITVVIGNPPYKNQALGFGGWIEAGSDGRPPAMDDWKPPTQWGVGAHTHHLKNLYVYFWRWATLKVFGSGWQRAVGQPAEDRSGIVCYITVAGFLNGPGFQKMREDLRRDSSDIWVIDCSADGHQPEVNTRVFQGVQQPVCIVLAARQPGKSSDQPACLRFTALPKGSRQGKFDALAKMSLNGPGWVNGSSGWRDPFLPEATGAWAAFPALMDIFVNNALGVMPGRTWVISPDAVSLEARWARLTGEKNVQKQETLFHPHPNGDKTLMKRALSGLPQHEFRAVAVGKDGAFVVVPVRYSMRSFDRQWLVPDSRLINRASPTLWTSYSLRQVFVTALDRTSPSGGPSITLTSILPDLDHYNGRGGRVYSMWADREATQPNIAPGFLLHLATTYGADVKVEDVMAYIAAVMAHPAFTARFKADLVQPGLRLPITASSALFAEAVELGSEVVWLHCYGERFTNKDAKRPRQAPRMPKDSAPRISSGGAIPSAPEPLPETMEYDPAKRRLHVGKGYIDNVSPQMWAYEVSGKKIVWQWFSYRRRDRTRPVIGDRRPPSPLDSIQPDHWLPEYTADLLDLLNVLGRLVALEGQQADLLQRICAGPLLGVDELRAAGALPEAQA